MRQSHQVDDINYRTTLRFLVDKLRPYTGKVFLTVFLTIVTTVLTSVVPLILGWATNIIFAGVLGPRLKPGQSKQEALQGLEGQGQEYLANMVDQLEVIPGQGIDFPYLAKICLLVLGLYIASSVFLWLGSLVLRVLVQDLGYSMRQEIDSKISRLPLSYIDKKARGDVLSRITNDVDNTVTSLQRSVSQILTALFQIIGIIVMMLLVSPMLTLLAVAVIPLGFFLASFFVRRARPKYRQQWKSTGELSAAVEDSYSGHDVMTLYGLEEQMLDSFVKKNHVLYQSSYWAQFLAGLARPVMIVTNNISFIVIAVVGSMMILKGRLSFGYVQAFINYARNLNNPLESLASLVGEVQSGLSSAQRVHEFLQAEEMKPDATATLADRGVTAVKGDVVFEKVSFGYEADKIVIDDLSMNVHAGQTAAIVGQTGSGKTTLVNLLMRFYEVNSGKILLDGVDISTISKEDLRDKFGMVLQDTWLFKGTIADNIAFGDPSAGYDEAVAAAKAVSIDDFILGLPQGFDTVIDAHGDGVSSGEKQLITIARAFLADPDILILDEATSSVDTRTEMVVQQAMQKLRAGRTSIVIAHRLSTIHDADVIMVMDEGRIVESGTHDELLKLEGAYAQLYEAQFTHGRQL